MYKELLKEVFEKYNYDDNMQNAIIYSLDAMISVYGKESLDNLINLFMTTPIFYLSKITPEAMDKIENEMLQGLNSHIVKTDEIDPYGYESLPGSYYSYQTIFDKDMTPIDHKKWITIKDMKDEYNGDKYQELFGTTINIPYLIHELNHAYAMQNPLIKVEGNTVYEKAGMYVTKKHFEKNGDIIELTDDASDDILLEEAINEDLTMRMLVNMFGVNSFDEVYNILKSINHVSSTYSSIIMTVAQKLEEFFGDKLMAYRRDNDLTMYDTFNEVALSSEIGKKYLEGKVPFEVLSEYVQKSYLLTCECFRYKLEDYKKLQAENTGYLLAPICAYSNGIGKSTVEGYEDYLRKNGLEVKQESR